MNIISAKQQTGLPGADYEIDQQKENGIYPFVDLIRFLSMVGIVWAHSAVYGDGEVEFDFVHRINFVPAYIAFIQVFKFGVICFFLISGFLLGEKMSSGNLLAYYVRRINSTVKPFLVVLGIYILFISYRLYFLHRDLPGINSFGDIIIHCMFKTPLWYLPNYLITLLCIMLFSRFVNKKAFGAMLMIITLSYSIATVYTFRFMAPHATALFSYLFFLWLGIYLKRSPGLLNMISSMPTFKLAAVVVAAYLISTTESYMLFEYRLSHLSILRIGNILYSLVMFAFLINVGSKVKVSFGFLNPRKETYGIYLYHGILTLFLFPKLINVLRVHISGMDIPNVYTYMAYHILVFMLTYIATTLLVKLLIKFRLAYL